MCREEKFSSCETVEGAEAADGWFSEIFDVENILEGKFFQDLAQQAIPVP